MTLQKLLDAFVRADSVSFAAFKLLWKQLRFAEVHFLHQVDKSYTLYHRNQREALQKRRTLTGFKTLLTLSVLPSDPKRRVGAVYCLYCLYSTQPSSPKHPVPISPTVFRILFKLAQADGEKLREDCWALQLLHGMYTADAFIFQVEDGVLSILRNVNKKHGEGSPQSVLKPLDPDLLQQIATLTSHRPPTQGANTLLTIYQESGLFEQKSACSSPLALKDSSTNEAKSLAAEPDVAWKPFGSRQRLELPGFLRVVKPFKKTRRVQQRKTKRSLAKPRTRAVARAKQQEGKKQKNRQTSTTEEVSSDDSDLDALESEVFGDMRLSNGPIATAEQKEEHSVPKKISSGSTARVNVEEAAVETTVAQSVAAAKEMEALLSGKPHRKQGTPRRRSPRKRTSVQASGKSASTAASSPKPKRKSASKRVSPTSSSVPAKHAKPSSNGTESDEETELLNSLALAKEMEGMLAQGAKRVEVISKPKPPVRKRKRREGSTRPKQDAELLNALPLAKEMEGMLVQSGKSVKNVCEPKPQLTKRKRRVPSIRPKQALSKPREPVTRSRSARKKPSSATANQGLAKRSSPRTKKKSRAKTKTKPKGTDHSKTSAEESSGDELLKGSKALADSLQDLLNAK